MADNGYTVSLKAARVNAGMSIKEAAAAMHVSYQMIVNYEAGINKISTPQMVFFEQLYNVPHGMLRCELRDKDRGVKLDNSGAE